jgi:S-layer homology domain
MIQHANLIVLGCSYSLEVSGRSALKNKIAARLCAALALAFTISTTYASAEPAAVASGAPAALAAGDIPFPDVPENSWAYDAIRQLSADGYLVGYPDGSFKGNRPMSRYEVSFLITKIVNAMKDQIAKGKTPPNNDLELINKLAASISTVSSDLKDVAHRVDTLQKDETALKKEADASRDQLRGAQILVNIFQRPGTFEQNVSGFNGPTALRGGTIAANGVLPSGVGPAPLGNGLIGATSQGTNLGQNSLQTGNYTHGTNWQETRIVFTGQPSPNLTYYIRLENKYIFNGPNYQSSTSPSACTSTTAATLPGVNACNSQQYDTGNSPVRVNQTYLMYTTPSGYFAKLGRWQEDEGTASSIGLGAGGNYTNGLQLGVRAKRFAGYVAYGFNDSALTNQALNNVNCPVTGAGGFAATCVNKTQQLLLGMVSYDVTRRTNVGAIYDGFQGKGYQLWNAAAGLCGPTATAPAGTAGVTTLNASVACPANTALIPGVRGAYQTSAPNLDTGTLNVTQFIGSKIKVTAEYSHRFGNDPTTGVAWQGSNAYGAQFDYASGGNLRPGPLFPGHGVKDSNVFELAWIAAGFNGLSPDAGPAGTTPWQAFYYSSLNGFQWSWATYQHWWSPTFRTGIVYHHFSTLPGQNQPAGSVTCPGCFIKVSANALFFESYLNM